MSCTAVSNTVVNRKFNLALQFSALWCLSVPKSFQKLYNSRIIIMYYISGVSEMPEWRLNKVLCALMYNSESCVGYLILHDDWITEALTYARPTGTVGSTVWPLWVAGEEIFFCFVFHLSFRSWQPEDSLYLSWGRSTIKKKKVKFAGL